MVSVIAIINLNKVHLLVLSLKFSSHSNYERISGLKFKIEKKSSKSRFVARFGAARLAIAARPLNNGK